MPRYVIERSYTVDESKVPVVATRSKRLARDEYPQIVWEHSHVAPGSYSMAERVLR